MKWNEKFSEIEGCVHTGCVIHCFRKVVPNFQKWFAPYIEGEKDHDTCEFKISKEDINDLLDDTLFNQK